MNGPKRCDCACHEHGARVFHAFPCCDAPIEADSLGTRESRFPAVPGSTPEPEKKPDPLVEVVDDDGNRMLMPATMLDELERHPRVRAAALGVARPFADPAQQSALAPLFRDFARIFGGGGS